MFDCNKPLAFVVGPKEPSLSLGLVYEESGGSLDLSSTSQLILSHRFSFEETPAFGGEFDCTC